MTFTRCARPIPLEVYHGVPRGWSYEELVAEHTRLGGDHELSISEVTEPCAPAWLPERARWLRYRAALYAVAAGVALKDGACIELAVRYIELRYIGSYSGFVREKLARRLRRAPLTGDQQMRLSEHFLALVLAHERTQEFRAYLKLWRDVLPGSHREIVERVRATRGADSASWLAAHLGVPSNG